MELHGPDSIAYIPKHGPCQRPPPALPRGVRPLQAIYSQAARPNFSRDTQTVPPKLTPKLCAPIGCSSLSAFVEGILALARTETGRKLK
jgi:hypothetical protein